MGEAEEIYAGLVALSAGLSASLDARLRSECGLALNRYEPMRVIGERGRCRLLDIASELGVGVSGVSKQVDRIEAAGHLTREAHPEDGRSSMLALTPAGRQLLDTAELLVAETLADRIGSGLSAHQSAQLAGLLRRLRER